MSVGSRYRRQLGGVPALLALALALVCTSCAGDDSSSAGSPRTTPASDSTYPSSIVVLGHSGTTGAGSDPDNPMADIRENSWATGTNPEVDSIYQRIVAENPAAEGHVANFGIDGSTVDSLFDQEVQAAAVTPAPELVLIQSIDNDIHCDGTDPQNFGPYRDKLTGVMDQLTADLPDAEVFFVSQWASVKEYDRVAMKVDQSHLAGTGPCDVYNLETQRLDPKRERYLQKLVDQYWSIVTSVCGKYPTCRTDQGLMKTMKLAPRDLAGDMNHLSVAGHHKMAALVWQALYG
jgi:lysophospholipase L1-like esterase